MPLRVVRLLLLAALAGAAANALAGGEGKKQYEEYVKNNMLYDDPAWQEYLTKVGERLVAQSPEPNKKIKFTLVDSSDVNAFATPDGYVFVFRGLIPYLESEDQLAAVVGHEIGHVVLHHGSRKGSAVNVGKVVGFVGAVLTGVGAVQDVTEQMTAEKVSGYGREMELEADEMGGTLLRKAGYDPFAMIEVIQILKDQETFATQVAGQAKTYHGLFATHPQNDKRLHDAVAASETAELPDQLVEPVGDFWEKINGFVYGDEAAGGVVKDRSFYHEQLRIVVTFPEGWDVASSRSQVTATAAAGRDAGVITFQKMATPTKKQTPKNYVLDTLQRDDVLSGEETKIDGNDAYVATLDTKGTNVQRSLLAVIYKDNNIYLFKGEVGTGGDPAKFEADFRATLAALRSMVPADLKVANGQRIKVIEAKPGDTFEKLARRSSIKRYPVETLRLLNADAPLGEPTPGDYIKIVQ